jgi:hypothetical protein
VTILCGFICGLVSWVWEILSVLGIKRKIYKRVMWADCWILNVKPDGTFSKYLVFL